MRLYIVRHAIAVPHSAAGIDEDDRPLTEEGINKMRRAAAGLYALGWIPDIMLTSPLIRARQTAEILVEFLGGKIKLKILPSLAPAGSRMEIYREINSYDEKKDLMIVGHQPSLGEIAGEICWNSGDNFIEFKKGGACAIELQSTQDVPRGHLVSLLTSSILCKVIK